MSGHDIAADERREADPAHDLLASPQALPLAVRAVPVTWPAVDAKRHPHKAERRSGPRASRFDKLMETT